MVWLKRCGGTIQASCFAVETAALQKLRPALTILNIFRLMLNMFPEFFLWCMGVILWMDKILHRFEAMRKPLFVGIYQRINSFQGFLDGAKRISRPSTV